MPIFRKFGEQRRRDRYRVDMVAFVCVNPFLDRPFPIFDISRSGLAFLHQLNPQEQALLEGKVNILLKDAHYIKDLPYKLIADDPILIPELPQYNLKRRIRFEAITIPQIQLLNEYMQLVIAHG